MPVLNTVLDWMTANVFVSLVFMMVIDIVFGLYVAYVAHTVNSVASWRGMNKKAGIIAVLAALMFLERIALKNGITIPLPASRIIAGLYCVWELISITENAARAGAPIPKALVRSLSKLRNHMSTPDKTIEDLDTPSSQGTTTTTTTTTTSTPGQAAHESSSKPEG